MQGLSAARPKDKNLGLWHGGGSILRFNDARSPENLVNEAEGNVLANREFGSHLSKGGVAIAR